ncbi:MAG: hypothetical protein JJ966_09090 [Balneolaceae bacterium]|nr:hypothetical protein [Balneolaceae bacterium]
MKSSKTLLFLSIILFSCTMFDGLFEEPERLWIEVASGERQCIPPDYASLDEAIKQLEDSGIDVFDKETLVVPVCEACSCPTGIYYRAYINKSDLDDAEELGWRYIHDVVN